MILILLSVLIGGLSNVSGQNNNCNFALASNGSTVSAISEGVYLGTTQYASYAIDGDTNSSWASNWDMPAWIIVDLNQTRQIDMIGIAWEHEQQQFSISISNDGSNWTTVVPSQQSNNTPGGGNSHELYPINSTNARYIKVDITATTSPPSHIFKALIGEIEAYELSCSLSSVIAYNVLNNINIYPNPAGDKLNIEFTDNINKIEKITLSNMLGQTVYTIKGKKINTKKIVIDLSEYKSGVYYLNIQTKEDGTIRNKISVVR